MRKKDSVWPRKIKNVEVDNDVIEIVISVCPLPDPAARDLPLTDVEYMCVLCGPERFVSQMEKNHRHESGEQSSQEERGKTCCNSKADLL